MCITFDKFYHENETECGEPTRLVDVILLIIRMKKKSKKCMKLLYPSSDSKIKNIQQDIQIQFSDGNCFGLTDEDIPNSNNF